MTTFLERHGLVQYQKTRGGKYPRTGSCELCDPGDPAHSCRGALAFDHCHLHGWVRGMICQGWNTSLAGPYGMEVKLRAATLRWGCRHVHQVQVSVDRCLVHLVRRTGPWIRAAAYLRNCPDCQIPDLAIRYPELIRKEA